MATVIIEQANLTKEPELKVGKSGKAWVSLRVAENRRVRDENGDWVDAPTKFHNVVAFGHLAENIAESLEKGSNVVIVGDQRTRAYRPDGTNDTVEIDEIVASVVAPSLQYGVTAFHKVTRSSTPDDADQGK